jgi:putative photosynthetic complex assembly protein 2
MHVWGPALCALLLWWGGTVGVMHLNGLPRATHPWSMALATVVLGLALAGVAASADDTRVTGAYLAFVAALLVWAWQELGFLLGYVTGPRRVACPPNARGWNRVRHAVMAILWHELALLALMTAIVTLTWGQPNQLAVWTFASLWLMRLSAKLNVFLGVRNLSEEFLPAHLRYLVSYFRKSPRNPIFASCVIVATLLAAAAWHVALTAPDDPFTTTAHAFTAMLLTLAVLEHWFMVVPLPTQGLWRLGLRSRAQGADSGC